MEGNRVEMQPEEIIRHVIADVRLEGKLTAEILDVVRKIAHGEMTDDEIEDWKRTRVLEIRSDGVKERLRLKYLPWNFDLDKIEEYERYLAMSGNEQKAFVADMSNDEFDFWCDLETARALYVDPADKRDGSITEEKVARRPDRYRWSHD